MTVSTFTATVFLGVFAILLLTMYFSNISYNYEGFRVFIPKYGNVKVRHWNDNQIIFTL